MKEVEETVLDIFTEKDKREMKKIEDKIQEKLELFDKEYSALAKESEKIYEREEKLKEKYSVLNRKTGLDVLYAELEAFFAIKK